MDRDGRHDELGKRFQHYLLSGIPELRKAGYNPTKFMGMIEAKGAVSTAKQLLTSTKNTSHGFITLWEKGKLDASVEYAVCLPWFRELFTDEELERAEYRLTEHRFDMARIRTAVPPDWYPEPVSARQERGGSAALTADSPEAGSRPPQERTYRQRVEAEEAAQRAREATRTARTTEVVRSSVFRALVLQRTGGRCENPGCAHPEFHVIGRNEEPIVEVDHVRGLKEGGADHPGNMVVLCPNCHAVKTRGRDDEVAGLRELLARIARERHEAAMTGA